MQSTLEEEIFTGKIDLALWRRIFAFAWPYRALFVCLITLGMLVALWDTLLPRISGLVVDAVTSGSWSALHRHAIQYIIVLLCFVCCIFSFILVAGRLATNISFDIRQKSFEKLQELPFSYYDHKAVGWLMARLTSDCSSLSRIMGWSLLDLVWGPCALIGVTVMMFHLNWRLALLVIAVTPVLLWTARFFQVRLLLTSRALRKANSQTTAAFNEGIVGVRTTKSMVREEQNLQEFSHLTGAMYTHAVRNAIYSAFFVPLMLSLCSIGAALALWKGGWNVQTGSMSIGELFTFLLYAGFVQWPVQELCDRLTQIQGAQASAERIVSLLDAEIEIKDSDEVRKRIESLSHRIIGSLNNDSMIQSSDDSIALAPDGLPDRIDSIEFRNVGFAYNAGVKVLENFNLRVEPGQSIALVGPTGGGKSTIVNLACRFYEPTAGQILINGIDYRQRSLAWLQSNIGMVLQQPHLFSGSVRENIRYGRLDAADADVESAAKLAHAHEFITNLPSGYDSPVGEGGNQLSTGQKQLISLARAIIARPRIFVMDEATSSVDTQTEAKIQSAIETVLAGRISFIIAHRLSTIRRADRILVIENGRIIEQGNHHELIAMRGRYYDLYTNQFARLRDESE